MKKTRAEKKKIIDSLKEGFLKSNAVFVSDYRGLTVSEISELRNRLRQYGARYSVVKNTLMRLAIEGTPSQGLHDLVDGPVAVTLIDGEPVSVAKVLQEFSKEFPKLELKGGLLGETLLSVEDIERLSKLPSRDALLGKLVGLLNALPTRLVCVLNGLPQKLVMTLSAIQREKERNV